MNLPTYHARVLLSLFLLRWCLSFEAHAQTRGELRALYDSITVDTRAFDSVKEQWVIVDPISVREIFTQLKRRASNALAGDSLYTLISRTEQALLAPSGSDVRVLCRKRYYDDEIELIAFQEGSSSTATVLGSIVGYVLVRDALGDETYELVKSRRYKDRFEATQGKKYDIYLNPLEPRLMLWSTSPTFEWWRVSAVGRLGNDYLALPFWFKSSIVAALEVLYVDDVTITDRQYSKFTVTAGIEAVNNFSVPGDDEFTSTSIFKKRILQGSGDAFFLRTSWTPASNLRLFTAAGNERLDLTLELSLGIHEKSTYAATIPDTFSSVRNSVLLMAQLYHVGLFHLGGGLAWHDLHRFSRYIPERQRPGRVAPTKNHFLPFLEVGIAHDGSLLQFDISPFFNYNVSEGYGYFGLKTKLIVSNMIGLDLRYFKAFRTSHLPSWQYDTYLVPTFVVRINY